MYQMHENIFKHSNKLKLFLIHDFFGLIFWAPKLLDWSLKCSGYGPGTVNKNKTKTNIPKTLQFLRH